MGLLLVLLVSVCCVPWIPLASGHGMVVDPVNRASRWREDPTAPVNYDDISLYCGGMGWQWGENGGRCGLCGDNYADPLPRSHELGGTYGQGTIVQSYTSGSEIIIQVMIKVNHLGYFVFHLCNLENFPGESEECFDNIPLQQPNGESKYYIGTRTGYIDVSLILPEGVECKHCVLRWMWTAGNSWGVCEDGTGALGCGAQETYRTCSDISILPPLTDNLIS